MESDDDESDCSIVPEISEDYDIFQLHTSIRSPAFGETIESD